MRNHRLHPLRRHDDPVSGKLIRSLIFFLSALLFATAVIGFIQDAEAQWAGYSLPNGAGGLNYYGSRSGYGGDRSGGMLPLGVQMMRMGNQAQMQRRQLAAQRQAQRHYQEWQSQELEKYRQLQERQASRETWTPESARAAWGMDR